MKFTVQREEILAALKVVAGVVEKKHHALPILSHVLLTITDNSMKILASDKDLEISYEHILQTAIVQQVGSIALPYKKLFDVLKAVEEKSSIHFSLEKNRILIKVSKSRFVLSILPVDGYPLIHIDNEQTKISIKATDLKKIIEKTAFSMADHDVRYYLNGMLLEINGNKFFTVAADGHRLAISNTQIDRDNDSFVKALIPRKAVMQILKLLATSEDNEAVDLILTNQHIRLEKKNVTLTSNLLSGRFPDYHQIIPKGGSRIVTASRDMMKSALLRSSALLTEKFRGVTFVLGEGEAKILAKNAEQDEVEEGLELEYNGDKLEIGFNAKYLLDFLNVVKSHTIKMTFSDAYNGALLEGLDSENALYVVMPMQI